MGGASGHLSHLIEDWDLTFADLKDVVSAAADARLESVTEKTDGINLVFTWNEAEGTVRVARNTTDIKNGGMAFAELTQRFAGRGPIEGAFTGAFKALSAAAGAMPVEARTRLFGRAGDRWYSIEVMYSAAPNTIRYAGDNIVFHEQPVFKIDRATGKVIREEGTPGAELSKWIDVMRKGASSTPWTLHPRAALELSRLTDGTVMARALSRLDAAMSETGLSDSDTIQTYVHRRVDALLDETTGLTLPDNVHAALSARIAGLPGAPNLTAIKKMAPDLQIQAKQAIAQEKQLVDRALAPLEIAMREFAVGLLKGVRSLFVDNPSTEAARLQDATAQALAALQRSSNPAARAMLTMMQDKLTRLDDISSIEGIVFSYHGRSYKLTGAFAPMNRVLGFFAYGGGDAVTESRRRLVVEGGHSFEQVRPVSLQTLRAAWPAIERLLTQAGAKRIEPIGTTWKKDPMGDVDLAMEHAEGREGLYAALAREMPGIALRRVGSNIVSVAFPLSDGAVQVDAMVGDVDYLAWARYGPSPSQDHVEHSSVKGVVRNMLLNVVADRVSGRVFPGKQSALDRERYVVDFDRGLFRVVQTKRPAVRSPAKTPSKKSPKAPRTEPVADWRTLEREHITSEPDELVAVLLGPGHKASELRRFEDLTAVLRSSSVFRSELSVFAADLIGKLRDYAAERGDDVMGTPLEQIEAFVRRELGQRP